MGLYSKVLNYVGNDSIAKMVTKVYRVQEAWDNDLPIESCKDELFRLSHKEPLIDLTSRKGDLVVAMIKLGWDADQVWVNNLDDSSKLELMKLGVPEDHFLQYDPFGTDLYNFLKEKGIAPKEQFTLNKVR